MMYAPPSAPLLAPHTGAHLGFAAGSAVLMGWLARRLFLGPGARPLAWFLPAFAMGLLPATFLALVLERKFLPVLSGFLPGPVVEEPDLFSFVELMRHFAQHHQLPAPPAPLPPSPYEGLYASLVVQIFGVGLIEEFSKWVAGSVRRTDSPAERRALRFLAGAGFGIAEGIVYAESHYNGTAGPWTYLARFISLVLLHGVWATLTDFSLRLRPPARHRLNGLGLFLLHLLPVAALHGAYNAGADHELGAVMLIVAATSVGVFFRAGLARRPDRAAPAVVPPELLPALAVPPAADLNRTPDDALEPVPVRFHSGPPPLPGHGCPSAPGRPELPIFCNPD